MSASLQRFLAELSAAIGHAPDPASRLALFTSFHELGKNKELILELLNNIADETLLEGDTAASTAALRLAAQLSPDPISLVGLANCLLEFGAAEEAGRYFDKALKSAYRQHRLVNYAAMASLRFCVRTRNRTLAQRVLKRLLVYLSEAVGSHDDIRLESDVVPSLRDIGVDEASLTAYREIADKRT